MQALREILSGLGMSQYLGCFVEEGFDSWDAILDITESDLDALGVKLGHRRKLQRRITETRRLSPNAVLPWTIAQKNETKLDSSRPMANGPGPLPDREGVVVKRKYRRHPKPDRNAPEKPPSAYVVFSNNIREGLKGQTLSFTDIAKLVGESWKGLPRAEKENLETQAQQAKEKYNGELAKYKRTPEYQKYSRYLQEFKKKQKKSSKGQGKYTQRNVEAISPLRQSTSAIGKHASRRQDSGPSQDHRGSQDDAPRRGGRSSISVGSNGIGGGSIYTTRGTSPGSSRLRRSGSSDTSVERLNSTGSWIISLGKDAVAKNIPLSPHVATSTGSSGKEVAAPRHIETTNQQALPSLSDMFDNRMTDPSLDRVEASPHLGSQYNRNWAWGSEVMMPTTGTSSVRRGTWPNTGGSLELYRTDTGQAKDAGLPIRSLLSNNLAPPICQSALCVSNNYV